MDGKWQVNTTMLRIYVIVVFMEIVKLSFSPSVQRPSSDDSGDGLCIY
jgi:hypothetical protein